jgi:Spy/CpxP family protein refolding chaperone
MDFFKQNKVAGSIIIILVVLNIVLISMFWLRGFRHPDFSLRERPRIERPARMANFFQRELGLTSEQVEKFDQQRDAFFQKMKPIMKQIHDLRMQLTDAIFAAQPDENLVKNLVAQISDLDQKREMAIFDHIKQVRAICTPEQQGKLKDLMRDVMMHFRPYDGKEPMEPHAHMEERMHRR